MDDVQTEFKHLSGMVESSKLVVTAWDYDYMVGFARLSYDEAVNGKINNVMVDSEYKDKGIEEELKTRIKISPL